MASDGKVVISTKLDNSSLPKGLGQAKGMLGGLNGVVKKLGGAIAAAFSVKLITDFAAECLNLGSDLQEVQNVVDVTFSTMNEQVNEFAKNAAKTAGLSETMAKKYTGTFGAMAKSFKFTEAEAYEMSTAMTQLTGDVASFYNLSQDEAYTKLKSVFTGETESLKDLGVVMTQTALDSFALQKGFGKTTSQMTEQEKVALRYQFVMEQLSGASGDFLRTSGSWANQTKLLSLQFDSLKASLGQGLINILTPAIKLLNDLMLQFQKVADAFRDFTITVFGAASEAAEKAADGYAEAAENTEKFAENIEKTNKAARESLAGFDQISKLGGEDAESSSNGPSAGVSGDSSASSGASVVEQAETAIDRIGAKLQDIWRIFTKTFASTAEVVASQWENVKQTFARLWGDITSLGSPLKDWFKDDFIRYIETYVETAANIFAGFWGTANTIFGDLWSKAVYPRLEAFITIGLPVITQFYEQVVKTLGTLFNGIKTIFEAVWAGAVVPLLEFGTKAFNDCWSTISDTWKKYGQPIFNKLREAINSVVNLFLNAWNGYIQPCWAMIMSAVTELWNKHLKPLWDNIAAFVAEFVIFALDIHNKFIAPVKNWLINVLGPIFKKIFGQIVEKVKNSIAAIVNIISGIITALRGAIQFITGVFTGDWKKAWEGVKKIFSSIWGIISKRASDTWKSIKGTWGTVSSWFNTNLIQPLKNFFAKMWTAVSTAASKALNSIKEAWGKVTAWFSAKIVQPIKKFFTDLWTGISSAASKAWAVIKEAWKLAVSWFSDKIIKPIKKFFTDLWTSASQASSDAWAGIKNVWNKVKSWFNTELIQPVKNYFAEMWDSLKAGASSAWQGVKNVFSSVGTFFENTFSTAWRKVVNVFSSAGNIFTNIKDGILSAFKSIVNKLISGINTVVAIPFNGINEALETVKGINIFGLQPFANISTISVPAIPYLAQGAVIPPNAPFMAVLGDQRHGTNIEAPLSTIQEAVALVMEDMTGGMMAGFEATVNKQQEILEAILGIEIGDSTIGEAVVRYNRKMAVARGG